MSINEKQNKDISFLLNKLRKIIFSKTKKQVKDDFDAEDITQEVLFRISRKIPQISEDFLPTEQDLLNYCNRITINEISRFYSKVSKLEELTEEKIESLESKILDSEKGLIILQNLAKLPIKQRLIYFLQNKYLFNTFIFHFSIKRIAAILEMSEKTLEGLINNIPLSEIEMKELIEAMTNKKMKSKVSSERFKGKQLLMSIFKWD